MKSHPAEVQTFSDEVRELFKESVDLLAMFEKSLAGWEARFARARTIAVYEQRRLVEDGVRTARRHVGHLLAATAIRVIDLASGVAMLINKGHAHPAFVAARSLVETTAVPSYVLQNVVPRIAKGRVTAVEEVLRRLTMGTDPGAGFGEEAGTARDVQPIRVSQLVSALCDDLQRRVAAAEKPLDAPSIEHEPASATMRRTYSMLSDHSHPNYSAVHLSATVDDRGMAWARTVDEDDISVILPSAGLAMYGGGEAFDDVIRAINQHSLALPRV